MSRTYIPLALRQRVKVRANFRCEYCLVHEEDVLIPYNFDHIIAEQHGGATISENLAYICLHCHRPKGPNIASLDLATSSIMPLFHPRQNQWSDHFLLDKGMILPRTPVGRVTVSLLKLNTPERVRVRQALILARRYP